MKILLKIPMSIYSGYGNDGIGIARALIASGADVYLMPTSVQAPLPADVAELLTKELVAPFDLTIVHVDPAALIATEELRAISTLLIGWTMWEFTNLGNLAGRSKLKKNLKHFDAIFGYDEVSCAALSEYYSGPVLTQQGGFWPEDWPEVERDWNEDNFYFCMVGMLHIRKDPFVSIQAFTELKAEHSDFDKHARLSLKTQVPGLHSKMEEAFPGLRIYYDVWSHETLAAFYASQHVLLAPSRGEGKNMPALEFQSTGGVVIATNWGGHRQWLHPSYSYPLDYTLEPVDEYTPNTLNARADVEHLKSLMLHAFRNRSELADKGHLAASVIPSMSSWPKVMEKLFEKIETLPGGKAFGMRAAIARQEMDRGNS